MQNQGTLSGDLRDVSVDELRALSQAQKSCFARGEANDDAAGLELFRRAMTQGDQAARQAVMDRYRGVLAAQASRRPIRGLVVEDDGFCVDRAFQRFWQASRGGHLQQLHDLASILKYLKLCLASVLLDEARTRRRQACIEVIARELVDPRELLVAQLSFVAGLTPREIVSRHPEKFHDVLDVYRTRRTTIDRLRRSAALRQLLASGVLRR